MTAPSQTPEAAGLEVVCWSSKWTGHTGQVCRAYHEDRDDAEYSSDWMEGSSEPLVTAASAQAAIDAEKAKVAELERHTQDALTEKEAVVSEYVKSVERLTDRATAAEARADRLAKALEPFARRADYWEQVNGKGGSDRAETCHAIGDFKKARAALQQETRK